MLEPEVVPNGGYNQEYRQNPTTSGGYIYSHAGADADTYLQEIRPLLPQTVSFATQETGSDLSLGDPGVNAVPSSATIYPYAGDAPAGLPRRFTLCAGDATVDFLLIARIQSLQPLGDGTDPAGSSEPLWLAGQIERHTEETIFAGSVLHELVGGDGSRYALVAAFDTSDAYDLNEVGGLAGLPPPPGYTYESRLLTEDFTLASTTVAYILVCSGFNFQLYT